MKLTNSSWLGLASVEIIARFGAARLVRKLDGRHELVGGTAEHHAAAREWCSLFAPDVVFKSAPPAVQNSVALRKERTSRLHLNANRIKLLPLNAHLLGHVKSY